jgi:Fe2+ transport system protein FeoA
MSAVMVLSQVSTGAEVRIQGFSQNCQGTQRLREMGLLPGTIIQLVRWAPLGDPLEIKVRGYHLSLRREQADHIEVTEVR